MNETLNLADRTSARGPHTTPVLSAGPDPTSRPLLLAEGLQAARCDAEPLTLVLNPGDRVGLLRGAQQDLRGLLRALARLEVPAAGHLLWNGIDVTRRPLWLLPRDLRHQVLLLWANPYALIEPGHSVHWARAVRGRAASGTSPDQLCASGLSPAVREFSTGVLSGVALVRLALTYVRLRQPRIVLVDDVFAHLVPESWPELLAALEDTAGEAGALVIASRHRQAVAAMTRIVVLGSGPEGQVSANRDS